MVIASVWDVGFSCFLRFPSHPPKLINKPTNRLDRELGKVRDRIMECIGPYSRFVQVPNRYDTDDLMIITDIQCPEFSHIHTCVCIHTHIHTH